MTQQLRQATTSKGAHTTSYLTCGPESGRAIIFLHGWPELSWSWRHQLPALAALGYRVIAPDMPGYGNSSVYQQHGDYAQQKVVTHMIDLVDTLGIRQAIWVGHDWGCATVWSIATHHPQRCFAVANMCVPFNTLERGWEGLLPHIDRQVYNKQSYPAGQWEYQLFYEESFAAATDTFNSDPYKVAKLLFRRGNPDGSGKITGTALTRQQGGWFGGDTIPDLPRDDAVVSEEDLQRYAQSLTKNTFFGPDSYYMNHAANANYHASAKSHEIHMPVLFLHGRYDYTCETITSSLAEPMRTGCADLTEHIVDSGHWMPQEQPDIVNQHLVDWLSAKQFTA